MPKAWEPKLLQQHWLKSFAFPSIIISIPDRECSAIASPATNVRTELYVNNWPFVYKILTSSAVLQEWCIFPLLQKEENQTQNLPFIFFPHAAELLALEQAGGQQMTKILFMEEELMQWTKR